MIDQMTTCQVTVTAAQAPSFSSNVVRDQLDLLSIITIQQAQNTWFRTLKFKVFHARHISINVILFFLSDIKNSAKLKEISNMKLTDLIFHEWKNMMLAEFEYYSIDKIIVNTHDSSISAAKFNHWLEIEQLFVQAFVTVLSAWIYEDVKIKISL